MKYIYLNRITSSRQYRGKHIRLVLQAAASAALPSPEGVNQEISYCYPLPRLTHLLTRRHEYSLLLVHPQNRRCLLPKLAWAAWIDGAVNKYGLKTPWSMWRNEDDTNLIHSCYVHLDQIDTETRLIHSRSLFDTLDNPADTNH